MASSRDAQVGFARLQAIAAQRLRWNSATFWAATPAELRASLSDLTASSPANACSADELSALMQRFPDT